MLVVTAAFAFFCPVLSGQLWIREFAFSALIEDNWRMIPQSGWGVKSFLNIHPTIDSLLCLKGISCFATCFTCAISAKWIEF